MNGPVRKKILLVEDEAIIALRERKTLERYGYGIVVEHSGERAIRTFEADDSIDLVLMDIDLGAGMDGTEAASLMLKIRDIPVVFLSSHTEPAIVEKTEGITSYGYIVKSSSATVLDASIKMAFKLFEANAKTRVTNVKLEATLDALPDPMFEVGLDGTYYDVHCPDSGLLYVADDDRLGKRIRDILPSDVADTMMAAIAEANERGLSTGGRYQLRVPSGLRWFEVSACRMASPKEDPRFILICRDFTERKKADDDLEESKRYAERLLNVAAEIILATDRHGVITMLNENGHRLLGYRSPELIGKNWVETCLPEDGRDEVRSFLQGLERGESGTLVPHENAVLLKGGGTRMVLWHNSVLRDASGKFVGVMSSGEDMTEFTKLEEEIRRREALYRTIIQASPDNITITDLQGRIVMFSPKALPMFGYDDSESHIGRLVTDFMVPEDRARAVENITRMASGVVIGVEEYRGLRKDGSSFDLEINGEFIRDSAGVPTQILFIVRDTTARRLLVDKYKLLFDLSPIGIALVDHLTGRFLDANDSLLRSTGYSRDELLEKTFWDITPPEYRDQEDEQVRDLDDIGYFGPNKKEYIRKDGSRYPISISGAIFIDDARRKVVWGLIEDITVREDAERRVRTLLEEKDLILKEVHHRIKNSFNVVRSLLCLQSDSIHDPDALAAFADTEGRIESLALLYEKLYESSDFIAVSLDGYLPALVAEIVSNFPKGPIVAVEQKVDAIMMDARRVQPLGIMVNELVTNAMKYAFEGRDRGRLSISAIRSGDRVLLSVEDDGVGMTDDAAAGGTGGFGLSLVAMLAKQLSAAVRIEGTGGTRVIIDMPAE